MTLSQLLLVLRARRKTILYTLFSSMAVVAILSLVLPKTYKATTTLVLNYTGIDPVTGMAIPGQMVPSYVATQVSIINSKSVALRAVKELKLAENASHIEKFRSDTDGFGSIDDWLATRLLKKLEVVPARDSNVVEVSFSDTKPEFAAAVANAFALAYQNTTVELKADPVKQASFYFNDRIKTLRNNLEAAQAKLARYQQEKGMSSADSRYDVESVRLNELSTQLVTVQSQLLEANSRQRNAQGKTAAESPDVIANPLIQNLKALLAQEEAKFSQLAQVYMPDHPYYQKAQAEVDKLRAELNKQIQAARKAVGNNAQILQQREAELSAALAAQKAKVLELNRARDQLSLLAKEVESAQRAYDAATQRVAQTDLESHFNQSNVAVLNPAIPPFTHTSPKLPLNLGIAALVGLLLGVGCALLTEMWDRRVLSDNDLTDVLQVPVLGSISWGLSERGTPALPSWRQLSRLLPDWQRKRKRKR